MTRYAKTMSQALAEVQVRELKMNDPKLIKVFDKLKPKDTIKLKVSSGISKGKDFQPYTVRAKNTLRNGVEKITMILQGNPTGVKRFLYKKDGKVTFAIGDMAASIDDIKEEVIHELDEGRMKDLLIKGQDLETYAKKHGGIDKKDMMKVAAMLKKGDKSGALKYAKGMDTDPRDYILDLMGEEVELSEDIRKKYKGKEQKAVDMMIMRNGVDSVQKTHDKNPKKFDAMVKRLSKSMKEEVELDEALKGFRVDFGKGMTKGSATYKNKKDAEEFAARRKRLGELPVKITQVTVKNANMFDDPMGPKRKRIPEEVELDEKTKIEFKPNPDDSNKTMIMKKGKEMGNIIKTNKGFQVMQFGKPAGKVFKSLDDIKPAIRKLYGEEVELDEGMKYTHVAVDKKGLVIGFASDEKDAKDMARRNDGKVVKLKKPMSDKKGDMMVNRPFKEDLGKEDEPKVKEIIKKLKGASQAHAGQAKDLEKAISENSKGKEMSNEKLTDGNLSLKETVLKMWQEAVSPAQQAAIAISKKEKEKKEEPDEGNLFTKALKDARDKGEKTFTVAGKTYDVKTEKLVGGQKKLDKDKDGDIDGKDFAMLRKAKKEEVEFKRYHETKQGSLRESILKMWGEINEKVEYVEYKFKNKNDAMKAKKMFDAAQLMGFDVNDDNISNGELMVDAGSKDMTKYHNEIMKRFKPKVMKTEKNDLTKETKHGKNKMTDTGKEMTPVDMAPKMPKIKNEKNKV